MNDIDFGKTITTTPQDDGSFIIREEVYYNGLNRIIEQKRVDVTVDQQSLALELMRCLDLVKTDTPEVYIRIVKNKYGQPQLLQKSWETKREKI